MSGQLTCGNCGYSWWSNASSARSRCGACRSVVYVPAYVRAGANSKGGEPSNPEAWNDEDDASQSSGATVLVVIGLVVTLVIAGVIWIRRKKPGYHLTKGAMTRWSCGHEATLSRPLDPGVTLVTAPCPICGRSGHRRPVRRWRVD
jgi:transcription elongation factor Elf1